MVAAPPTPSTPYPEAGLHTQGHLVWAPLRGWVDVRNQPEEVVRQEWIRALHLEGGYALEQMAQEIRTHSGRRSPRADIVVWRDAVERRRGAAPVLVVETKAGEGAVRSADFWQGESYARSSGARFLILANQTSHAVFELSAGLPGRAVQINVWPRALDIADERRLDQITGALQVFDREQFQRVLFECHTLLRDNHAMTPDRAFDTISKVLFIKLHVERSQTHETFTTGYLDQAARYLNNPRHALHEQMFEQTKDAYASDDLFAEDDRLDVSAETFRELVSKLERFNLSKTGEDIKGIAFERFLGRTFRGELGQFFTPRPVVDFIINVLDPQEGELVCDPAAGSGGFLIRVFDHVRDRISEEIARSRELQIESISAEYPEDADESALEERDQRIEQAIADLNKELAATGPDGSPIDTRVGRLAWRSIFGTDKEPRAARTAKMNMIMHGDGHGGIHWHDGLVDVNGIFEGRFDVVVTNPPFGATVTASQRIGTTAETDVPDDPQYRRRQAQRYGAEGVAAFDRVANARGQRILDQFEIGRDASSRKTEQMFLERCLRLLRPGGRLGIVLPNGNLNAASQAWLRRWAEGRAFLRAVVALPAETFRFSGASVTASVVFLERFSDEDAQRWEACWADAFASTEVTFADKRSALIASAQSSVVTGDDPQLKELLSALAENGVRLSLPQPQRVPKPGLVRGAPVTSLKAPTWSGRPTGEARTAKARYVELLSSNAAAKSALADLRRGLRDLDEEQTQAMWRHVRNAFDYSVLLATPSSVGITATGDTGGKVPNDLPEVLQAWRTFRSQEASEVE
jgi:type I restriction enzyme M protein